MSGFFSGSRQRRVQATHDEPRTCFRCGVDLTADETYQLHRVCSNCRFHYHLTAWERVRHLCDARSFRETEKRLMALDPLAFVPAGQTAYRQKIYQAQRRTGMADAAITGRGRIFGRPVVLAVIDFAFLGGSMGNVVGEKVAAAFELAARRRIPLVTVISSSGVRMQEGALALMQLAKTASAARLLERAGVPHISIWANPTTGGVYASFANLADFIIAEPDAIAGFGAMRAVQAATSTPIPEGAHTAESHLERGLIDQVVDRTKLKTLLGSMLDLLAARPRATGERDGAIAYEPHEAVAWQQVELARHARRPTALDYIARMTSSFIEMRGDRVNGDDPAVVAGLAQVAGETVVIVGHERTEGEGSHPSWIQPQGFRKAARAFQVAAKLDLPVITLIDTSGAHPGLEAEEQGLGHAAATCMATLADLRVPTVAAVIGEGGSEGAMAFAVADRVLMLEHAIFAAISPEDAAAILYRDPARATDVAQWLKVTARDCHALGVVDAVVPEPVGGAHTDHEEAARLLKTAVLRRLSELRAEKARARREKRYRRYREFGRYANPLAATVARQVDTLKGALQRGLLGVIGRRPGQQPAEELEAPAPDEDDTAVP